MQRKHGNGDKHRRFRAYTLKPNTDEYIKKKNHKNISDSKHSDKNLRPFY